jgi:hypothetical protein
MVTGSYETVLGCGYSPDPSKCGSVGAEGTDFLRVYTETVVGKRGTTGEPWILEIGGYGRISELDARSSVCVSSCKGGSLLT